MLEELKKQLDKMIASLTIPQIIKAWNETENNFSATSPVLRGAIMERMERENPEKYWQWIETDDPKIENFYN